MISLNICSALNISFGMILDHFSQLEYTSVYFSYFTGCTDTDVVPGLFKFNRYCASFLLPSDEVWRALAMRGCSQIVSIRHVLQPRSNKQPGERKEPCSVRISDLSDPRPPSHSSVKSRGRPREDTGGWRIHLSCSTL